MKFVISQHDFLPALQAVSRSVGVKSSLPVLSNILIQTEDNGLKLSATNLEIGIIRLVAAQIVDGGEVTVPARTLLEIVSSLPNEEIEVEADDAQLKISTKSFSANLNGIPAIEFPAIPLSKEQIIAIPAKIFLKSIPQISFAAAVDEGRPVLTTVLTEIKGNVLEFVATDGFRLAHKKITMEGKSDQSLKFLIPKKTLEEVVRIISEEVTEDDQLVSISTTENQNQIIFTVGNTTLSSRLVEGNFPPWEKIIPKEFINKTKIDRTSILKALKLASVFAKGEANIIKIEIASNKLTLLSEAKELGGQHNELIVESEGDDVTISFNTRFLGDALNAANEEKLIINFSSNLAATLIKPEIDDGLEYVVMPIRVS